MVYEMQFLKLVNECCVTEAQNFFRNKSIWNLKNAYVEVSIYSLDNPHTPLCNIKFYLV